MTKKQPALITRYKTANAEVDRLTKALAESQKKLESSESMKKHYSDEVTKLKAESEQLHQVFDSLPGAAPRKTEGENSWDRIEITLMARLASFLAKR